MRSKWSRRSRSSSRQGSRGAGVPRWKAPRPPFSCLAVIVGAVGVPLIHYVPINGLRVVVGALLLVVGLTWLRKAILRASGLKAPHDEDAIFAATTNELSQAQSSDPAPSSTGRDRVGFAVSFKGVFLEGTEVVLIVVGLGASQHRLGLAAAAAAAAAILVAGVGIVVARQLSQVPENAIKLTVGVMLTSFGLFWVGEGAGEHWPGSDLAILALVGLFAPSPCSWSRSCGPVRPPDREPADLLASGPSPL